ncbi:MAG: IclR family transcriptional regulator [Thermomicrobiales bacterium]
MMQPLSDSLQSVERALRVVEVLVHEARPMSVREISEQIGINRTTAHRLVATLCASGWAERAPDGRFQLSVKFLAIGHVINHQRRFLDEIRPELVWLSQLTRETVHVGVLDRLEIVHIDKIESMERVGVSSRIGTRGAVHSTSLGMALMAAHDDLAVERYIAEASAIDPPLGLADPDRFRARIADAHTRGFTMDDEDDSVGVRCVGVAVRGPDAQPIFAISVTGPSPRFTREIALQHGPEVARSAERLSLRFGYAPATSNRR